MAILYSVVTAIALYQASIAPTPELTATPAPEPTSVPLTSTPRPRPTATATVRPAATIVPTPRPAATAQAPSSPSGAPTAAESAILARIRQCESTNRYNIVHTSGIHYGAYGFDLQTWQSVGGTGYPHHASPAEQDYRALLLYRSRGIQPWPVCGPRAIN